MIGIQAITIQLNVKSKIIIHLKIKIVRKNKKLPRNLVRPKINGQMLSYFKKMVRSSKKPKKKFGPKSWPKHYTFLSLNAGLNG